MQNPELSQLPDFITDITDFMTDVNPFDAPDLQDADGFISCPLLILRGTVLYPQMVMPLFLDKEDALTAVNAALDNGENIITAAERYPDEDDPMQDEVYVIGTETSIGKVLRMPDNSSSALAQGQRRVEIVEYLQTEPYIRVRARVIPAQEEQSPHAEPLIRVAHALFERVVDFSRNLPEDAYTFALNIDQPGWLADFIVTTLNLSLETQQDILETFDPLLRLQKVSILLAKEVDVLEAEDKIHAQVQDEVDSSNREHFLREQMRIIQKELGEKDIFEQELDELQQTIADKKLPDEARAQVDKEMARLKAMPPMSPDVGIIRTYIDWILELPWDEQSEDKLDVVEATAVLDAAHYGLPKVKDRIIETIAVKKIASDSMKSPILCFVGPPGTGKTSIGRSIAEAMGREFVRISLGGVRDEAEIRGHRRTYVGALPGRIIQAMRRVGSSNPLFMLDEIDKLGHDFRGDPASALLEVLDPEQNHAFVDHYLDLDFDLSKVMFVTTANVLHTVPYALQDRMEVIEFSGYLEEEKIEICRRFLIPRQLEQHGLDKIGLTFNNDALHTLIDNYTREAGVRNLERELASVCRKIARQVAAGKRVKKRITAVRITKLLGTPRFMRDTLPEEDEVGVVTGAAWTAAGGEIMFIELTLMAGKGNMTLTGQLGDVMRESAQAALTYTRSQAEKLGIDDARFDETDIHIHIPEGAVPKDGPSAGVTLVTALVSAFTNRPVRRTVSMTGEITLRGRVLPIGGLREKALAARRAGITTFILPEKNRGDLSDIPARLRKDMEFVLVKRVDEVLDVALMDAST